MRRGWKIIAGVGALVIVGMATGIIGVRRAPRQGSLGLHLTPQEKSDLGAFLRAL